MGALFSTTATAGTSELAFGVTRLVAGLTFSLGLILVVVAGAELFTENNLVVMAWAGRRVTTARLLWIWLLVYLGNTYFIPFALFVKSDAGALADVGGNVDTSDLTWGAFLLDNLLPVTLGNLIGGTLMVGAVYWFVYLRVVDRPGVSA